jgi:hypothetical protein
MNIKLTTLEETKKVLLNLQEIEKATQKGWSTYQIFVHCSKTIEYSMVGYPKLKPALVRSTVGKIAISKFLKQGYMSHNLTADVPGSPIMDHDGTFQEGREILLNSIDKFLGYDNELAPHLLFGKLNKDAYNTYFAMHIADHLSELA